MAKKTERDLRTTPKGEFCGFLAIQNAATNFNADGVFQASIALDPEVAQEIIEELERLRDEKFDEVYGESKPVIQKKLTKLPVFKMQEDDDGDETGLVTFKFSQKRIIRFKDKKGVEKSFEKSIAVFDAKGKPVKRDIKIGHGSMGRVTYEPFAFYSAKDKEVGVSLRLEAVQVTKLVQYSGTGMAASAADMGFDPEDDDEDAFDLDAFSADDEEDGDDTSKDTDEEDIDDEIPF